MNPPLDNAQPNSSTPGMKVFAEPPGNPESFILGLNHDLLITGARHAEQAFSVGCAASLVPIGFILLIAYIVGARNWFQLTVIGLFCVLVATAAAAFISNRSRDNAIRQAFQDQTQPTIQQYLQDHSLSLNTFKDAVINLLPLSAPLRQGLISPQEETQTTEER